MATSSRLPFAQRSHTERSDPSTIMLEVGLFNPEMPGDKRRAAALWERVPPAARTFDLLRRVVQANPDVLRHDARASDPEVMGELIGENPALIAYATADLLQSVDFARGMIEHNPSALLELPFHEEVKSNPELALQAIRLSGAYQPIFSGLPQSLRDDVAFCRQAQALFDGGAIPLPACGANVVDDRDLMLQVLARHPAAYRLISPRLRGDLEVFRVASRLDAATPVTEEARAFLREQIYPFMQAKLTDDAEFIDARMAQDPQIFRWASARLRDDVQRTAVAVRAIPEMELYGAVSVTDNAMEILVGLATRGPSVFRRASPALRANREFLETAVKSGVGFTHLEAQGNDPTLWPLLLQFIKDHPGSVYMKTPEEVTWAQDLLRGPDAFRNDPASMRVAIPLVGMEVAGPELMDNAEFVWELLDQSNPGTVDSIMRQASLRVRGQASVGQYYFDKGGRNLGLIAVPLSNDRAFIQQFIERDAAMLAHVGSALKNDLSFIREVAIPLSRTAAARMSSAGASPLSLTLSRLLKPLRETREEKAEPHVTTFAKLDASRRLTLRFVRAWAEQAAQFADDLPAYQREVYLNALKDAILSRHTGLSTMDEAKLSERLDLKTLRERAEQVKGWRMAAGSITPDLIWPTFLASQRKMSIDPVFLEVASLDAGVLRERGVLSADEDLVWSEMAQLLQAVRTPPLVKTPKTQQEYAQRCTRAIRLAQVLEDLGVVNSAWSPSDRAALLDPASTVAHMPKDWWDQAQAAIAFAQLRPTGLEHVNPYRGFQMAAYEAVCAAYEVDPFGDDAQRQAERFAAANVANLFGRDLTKAKRFVSEHPANARRRITDENALIEIQAIAQRLRQDDELFEEFKSDMDLVGYAIPKERSYGDVYLSLYQRLSQTGMIKMDMAAIRPEDLDDEDWQDHLSRLPDIPFEDLIPSLTEIIEASLKNQFDGRISMESRKSPSMQLHDAGQFNLPPAGVEWNKEEWIALVARHPECSQFIESFPDFERHFGRVATGPLDLQRGIKMVGYGKVSSDEASIAALAADLSMSQESYRNLLQHAKNPKTHALLPDAHLEGQRELAGYSLHLMGVGDPRALVIGDLSSCCQKLRGAGEAAAIHSFEQPSSGVYYIENAAGEMVAQAFSWLSADGKWIILDSIESRFSDAKNVNAVQALFVDLALRLRAQGYGCIVSSTGYGMTRDVRRAMGIEDLPKAKVQVPPISVACGYLDCRPGSQAFSLDPLVERQQLWPTRWTRAMSDHWPEFVRPAAWRPRPEEFVAQVDKPDGSVQVACRTESQGQAARILVQAKLRDGGFLAYDEKRLDLTVRQSADVWKNGKPGQVLIDQAVEMVERRNALPDLEKTRLFKAMDAVVKAAEKAQDKADAQAHTEAQNRAETQNDGDPELSSDFREDTQPETLAVTPVSASA